MLNLIIPKIMAQESSEKKESIYRPRCSNLGIEKCIRQMVMWGLNYKPENWKGRTLLVFDDSAWHEELTADKIEKTSYKLHSRQMEVEIEISGQKIKGHIDGILTNINGQDWLWEHKAINHFTWQSYESGDLQPLDYITQCIAYIIGLKKITGKLLPAILQIKNKNTASYLEFLIDYDDQTDIAKCRLITVDYKDNPDGYEDEKKEFFVEDIFAKAEQRVIDIQNYIDKKTLPARPFTIDSWHCEYCRWNKHCWAGYEKEIKERTEIDIKEKEILTKAKECYELNEQKKSFEKKIDEIKTDLQVFMTDKKANRGNAKEYIILLTQKERETIDKNKIPPVILEQAKKLTRFETLAVKKIKGGNGNGK